MSVVSTVRMVPRYVEHDTLIWEYLNSSIHLAPYLDEKLRKIYAGDAYKFYRQRFVLINRAVVQSCLRNQGCKKFNSNQKRH